MGVVRRLRIVPLVLVVLMASMTLDVPFGTAQALVPPPAAPGSKANAKVLEGNWQGTLKVSTFELRLAFHVTSAQDEAGAVTATFDSIDQGATGLPVDRIALAEDGTATFTLKKLASTYQGKLNPEGTQIDGTWTQGGITMPLVMKRTSQVEVRRRPQTPEKPYPYAEIPLQIENPAGKVTLAGTLTVPRGDGPFPAVVLISGSGAQDRDETILGHKPFLVLADALTRRGVAVLRVDDRGVGGSSGATMASTSEDFTGDVLAEVAALKARPEVNPRKIGLIGHSEGGLIAAMVASRSGDVAFIVLMAGPGLPGEQILRRQGELITRAMGADDREVQRQQDLQRRLLDIIKAEPDPKRVEERIRAALKESVTALTDDEKKQAGALTAAAKAQVQLAASPWLRFYLTYDPRPVLENVRCPVLALIGEKDLQVAPRENLDAIAGALRAGGNGQFQVRELPGLNHLFQTCRTGSVTEYGTIEETLAPVALKAIGDWVMEQTGKP
jgi:pimeloyl-ACP methyl ester carboxylesterase